MRRRSCVLLTAAILVAVPPMAALAQGTATDPSAPPSPDDTCEPQPDCRVMSDDLPPGRSVPMHMMRRKRTAPPGEIIPAPKDDASPAAPSPSDGAKDPGVTSR